jgi:hypothetical protein
MRFITVFGSVFAVAIHSQGARAVVLDTEGLPDSGLNTSSWVTGVKPPLTDIFNLHDMQLAVKNYLGDTEYGR